MNILAGADEDRILEAVQRFDAVKPGVKVNPYDFGGASKKIIERLMCSG